MAPTQSVIAGRAAPQDSAVLSPQNNDDNPANASSAGWLDFVGLPKIVDRLYQSGRDFWAPSGAWGKLSPGQKVVGAVASAGAGYLVLRLLKSGRSAASRDPESPVTCHRPNPAYRAPYEFCGERA